jgi:hypothetical protein
MFSQQFCNQRKILSCIDTNFIFFEEKVFRSYQHFYKTLKPNLQGTAKNFEKRILQKCPN